MLKLVKDYLNQRTVFYWVDNTDTLEPISEQFRSFVQAEEWWKEHMFTQFSGRERRASTEDRRQNLEKRQEVDQQSNNSTSTGRRMTDLTVRVNIDLHKEKTS